MFLDICSRCIKQTEFSGQKIMGGLKVKTDYFCSSKGGYDTYAKWKRLWSSYGKTDNGTRVFMGDQMLPYWVQCTQCDKWRQVYRETDITPQYLKTYLCQKNQKVSSALVVWKKIDRSKIWQGFFQQFWEKASGQNWEKWSMGEINDIEHN